MIPAKSINFKLLPSQKRDKVLVEMRVERKAVAKNSSTADFKEVSSTTSSLMGSSVRTQLLSTHVREAERELQSEWRNSYSKLFRFSPTDL